MPLPKVIGQVACPKRLWAGMARDACCSEQAADLCPPGCDEGERAQREASAYWEFWERRLELRRQLGKNGPFHDGLVKVQGYRRRAVSGTHSGC